MRATERTENVATDRTENVAAAPIKRLAFDDPASRYENRASAVAVAGQRLFVGTQEGRVLALDARSGTIVWQFKTADAIIATPVVAHGRVYCGSFDGHVYALDASSGALAWKHDTGGAVTSAVAVSGSKILAGSRSFDFDALDAATGRLAWTKARRSSSPAASTAFSMLFSDSARSRRGARWSQRPNQRSRR